MRRIPLVLIFLGAATASAADIELRLKDGSTVRGELVSTDTDKVVVKQTIEAKKSSLTATRTYQRSDIDTITEVEDATMAYSKRAAATKDTPAEQLELATWCRENGLRDRARTHALRSFAGSPVDPAATKLLESLGMILVDGSWHDETAYLEQTGKVRFDGRIVTKQEADTLRASARMQATVAQANRDAADRQRAVAAHGAEATSLQARLDEITKQIQGLDAQIAKADAAKQRSEQATAAYMKASSSPTAGGAAAVGSANAAAAQAASAQATADTKRLRDLADAARAEAAAAEAAGGPARIKKASLQREQDIDTKKLDHVKAEELRAQHRLDEDYKAAAQAAASAPATSQPAARPSKAP